jgi:hypothetical protein
MNNIFTIKYNSSGVEQWRRRYHGPHNQENAKSICVDNLGNVYVAGSSLNAGSGYDFDIITIKYSPNGDQLWTARYGDPSNRVDGAASLAVDSYGNVYVAGSSQSQTKYEIVLLKYLSTGTLEWKRNYRGEYSLNDFANSMMLDVNGNIIITGNSDRDSNFTDIITLKYNSDGVLKWKSISGSLNRNISSYATCMALDRFGNVYSAGWKEKLHTVNKSDIILIKHDSSGHQLWIKTYDGTANGNDVIVSMQADTSGNIYVTGVTEGLLSNKDIITAKYDATGNILWQNIYNDELSNYIDQPAEMVIDGKANIYIVGSSLSDATNGDLLMIKYDYNGIQKWLQKYSYKGGQCSGFSIALDYNSNILVEGAIDTAAENNSLVTLKYSQSTEVQQISTSLPNKFHLSQNYPNPFNPNTVISFQLPVAGFVKLKVFDLLGREIANLVNENLSAGSYKYDFNASALPSGIYFYKLETENFSETRKMVLVK